MSRHKLVAVEGIPGSGKTTMAKYVQRWLDDHGIPNRLYCEGDLAHPADFEAVAYFASADYAWFLARHPGQQEVLAQFSYCIGDDCFVHYGQLAKVHRVPERLVTELAERDVYEIADIHTHARLIRDRWRRFVEAASRNEDTYVFECCVLQNPFTIALLKHNLPQAEALRYVQTILQIIRPLNPLLIYLRQRDVRATLERAAQERPREWRDFVSAYTDHGAWAQETGIGGYEGFIAAQSLRQALELSLLRDAGISHLVVDTSDRDWDAAQVQVGAFLREKTRPDSSWLSQQAQSYP
jgi:hypothetical protein